MAVQSSRKRSGNKGHHSFGTEVTLSDGTTAFLPSTSIINSGDIDTEVAVDTINNSIVTIESEHYRIHQGQAYRATVQASSLASSASFDVLLDNPAANYPHLRSYSGKITGGPCDVFFYEGTTTSAAGTAVTAVNMSRNSSNTADLVITHTPTVTDVGTQIEYTLMPEGHKQGGGWSAAPLEWILKVSTKYLIRITNNNQQSVDASVEFFWYES